MKVSVSVSTPKSWSRPSLVTPGGIRALYTAAFVMLAAYYRGLVPPPGLGTAIHLVLGPEQSHAHWLDRVVRVLLFGKVTFFKLIFFGNNIKMK